MNNSNCDGSGPHSINPEVRVLPIGEDSNAVLCIACYDREIQWRQDRNLTTCSECKYDLPTWSSLKVYEIK